jgi:hypothetical protein
MQSDSPRKKQRDSICGRHHKILFGIPQQELEGNGFWQIYTPRKF